jgi:Tfp pilus assembly PilM family ATPase
MSRLLAIEWDGYEARVAVARKRGGDVVVDHAFCVALSPRDPGQTVAEVNVGERIAAALAARQIGRVETLVSVGRASIELRLLTLPPADDDELPDMVRFQAMRQFSTLGDDWPVDYVPVGSTTDGGHSVLAAAISPKLVAQIQRTCHAADLTPKRLVLRPFAAASLLCRRRERAATRVRLMVDLLTDEADLTVLIDRSVVFMRTVRLPAKMDATEQADELVAEVRRTMAAAQNQLGGQRVDSLVLCSAGDEHRTLKDLLEAKLSLPVAAFDPFEGVSVSRELRSHPPDAPGRFAPLLGLLLDEASQTPHAIDFLHPRQKTAPPSRRRTAMLAAAAGAAVILAVLGYLWLLFAGLAAEKRQLGEDLRRLERESKAAAKSIQRLEEIDKWMRGEVIWLDEPYKLSADMPPAEEAIVEQWQAGSRSQGGGTIVLDGLVSDVDVIERMEQQIRGPAHSVTGTGSHQDDSHPDYGWRYHETVIVQNGDALREPSGSAKPESGQQPGSAAAANSTPGDSSAETTAVPSGGAQ